MGWEGKSWEFTSSSRAEVEAVAEVGAEAVAVAERWLLDSLAKTPRSKENLLKLKI